jgi:DNA-binding FadR family transcriptional regulator
MLLHTPDIKEVAAMMAIHLMAIGTSVDEVLDARKRLEPVLENGGMEAFKWAHTTFDMLLTEFDESVADIADTKNRALLIARRIARDYGLSRRTDGSARIDTIEALEERHATGAQVILQALRVLEDLELIEVQRGRKGGFVASMPSPSAIVRATYPYFVLSGMSASCTNDLVWAINKVGTSQASLNMERGQGGTLEAALSGISSGCLETGEYIPQIAMWRALADAADNKVLHVLVRCLFYYQVNSGLVRLDANVAGHVDMASFLTERIARAVLAGNPVAAVDAVTRLEHISRRDEIR